MILMKKIIFVFIAIAYAFSCTPEYKRNTGNIRYVNIKKVCDFLDQKSPEYSRIYFEIRKCKNEISQAQKLSEHYDRLNDKLESLEEEMNAYKRKNYQLIENILEQVSDKHGLDFILQYSEHVIYARKKFDITDEVIREIIKLEERQSIINR